MGLFYFYIAGHPSDYNKIPRFSFLCSSKKWNHGSPSIMENFSIALVSCSGVSAFKSNIESEDELLLRYFEQKGVDARTEVWDDPQVAWERYDVVMIKSTWDYFDKPVQFRKWLDEMELRKINLFNPVPVLRWNMDKIYLEDLEAANLPVIPSVWMNRGESFDLKSILKRLDTEEIIVKPRISGASKNTIKVGRGNLEEAKARLQKLTTHEDFMAQPYMQEVEEGEHSYLFFDGQFSHAINKVPKKNDFRVQHYFGGSIEPIVPQPFLLKQAQRVSDLFASECLYARVDGIVRNGILHIIELEVIEPMLYLFTHPASFDSLLAAIRMKLKKQVA